MQITVAPKRAHELKADLISLALIAPDRPDTDESESRNKQGAAKKAASRRASKASAQSEAILALPRALARFDRELGGAISALLAAGDFKAAAGETAVVYPGIEGAPTRVQLIGLGALADVDAEAFRRAGARAASLARDKGVRNLALWLPSVRSPIQGEAFASAAEGAVLGAYRFDGYRSGPAKTGPQRLALAADRVANASEVRKRVKQAQIGAEGQTVARDLSNEPPNALPPSALAQRARAIARKTGLRCRVLGPTELAKRKMNALLAVGEGSAASPRLIVLEHKPKGRAKADASGPLCVVGKGITFDSGGLSLKTAAGMLEMKHDMSGAATVVGLMQAIARLSIPMHVVGVIAAAENMPSGTASRPGDVVRAMSGKTIEILNTDAEGRVVLADALHFANVEYSPSAMVDVATLTGAIMAAFGPWATGVFSRDEDLVDEMRRAGDRAGERMWPMPLLPEHLREMKSQVADLKNTGGPFAGGSTAAAFLGEFAGETPWVHLDIAGSGMTAKSTPYHRGGGTGVGVRALLEWVKARSQDRP